MADILLQQAVDGFQLLGLLAVLHIVKQLVIAVNDDDQAGRTALIILVKCFLVKGIIDQIHKAGTAAALGSGGVSRKAPFPHRQVLPVRAGADGQIQLRQNAVHRAGHGVTVTEYLLSEVAVVPQDTPVIHKHGSDGQVGQAVLDAAVLKVCAAELLCQKGAQTAALIKHHAQRNKDQHRRDRQQLRLDQCHRHNHDGNRCKQQQHDGGHIQTILVFHRTLPCSIRKKHLVHAARFQVPHPQSGA